jgi:hypothetical protein
VRQRIAGVAESLDAFSPGGLTWPVGDGDEGQALPTGEPFESRVRASLECAARLVGTPGGPAQPRARWLGWAEAPETAVLPFEGTRDGYAVARRGRARLLFDAAELGLAPLYAHGHADALMVLLDVDGPRLVDPGTGGYHAHAKLRERLRATRAHNTVEVDDSSQSTPGGLFQWLRAARISERAPDGMAAAHDGYARLGVTHRRRVAWEADDRIVVEDRLEGTGTHRAVTRWHLGDGRAQPAGPYAYVARWPDGYALTLRAELPEGGVTRASDDAAWAPRFLAARPCGVVEWTVEGRLPLSWRTTILLGGS